jgi:DNA-binding NtrC family response regulator
MPPTAVPSIATYSSTLHATRDFESAATALLRAMFQVVASSISRGSGTRLLRGTIHFRPENEYRRLFSLEFDAREVGEQPLQLPSLTAWRWVASRGCPVTIDVDAQMMRVFEGGAPRLFRDDTNNQRLTSGETVRRLTARDADYVMVHPLRRHAGIVDGMVSLELRGTDGNGDELQSMCGVELQLLADLAAPHLANLPSTPVKPLFTGDEYLPVVGASMAPLVELLRVFSSLDETLLITGATGVGKSRLARFCHAHSTRRDKPFITLDLLACPESLQLPRLCGAKKGAYTGADRDIPGAIQRAEGGTLFIDEIDKLSLQAQAGLLRLIEDRIYRCIGDTGDDRKADVRFIVGTTANLREAVEQGRFREDLYYRIAVLFVRIPALEQRTDELAAWGNFMIERCSTSANAARRVQLHESAVHILERQMWPGNLRQLDNVIRRAYAYSLLEPTNSAGDALVVSTTHIARAIGDELGGGTDESNETLLSRKMREAAKAFADEALKRSHSDRPLLLTLADTFRSMVLDETLKACGQDKDVALEALGLGNVVRDRNHHRVLRKETELLQKFYAELSLPPRVPAESPSAVAEPRDAVRVSNQRPHKA